MRVVGGKVCSRMSGLVFFCSFGRPVNPKKFLYTKYIQSAPRRSKTRNHEGREALNISFFLRVCFICLVSVFWYFGILVVCVINTVGCFFLWLVSVLRFYFAILRKIKVSYIPSHYTDMSDCFSINFNFLIFNFNQ